MLENQHHRHHHHHHHHDCEVLPDPRSRLGGTLGLFSTCVSFHQQHSLNCLSGGRVCLSLGTLCFFPLNVHNTHCVHFTVHAALLCFALLVWCADPPSLRHQYCSHSSRAHLRVRTHLVSQRSKLATCRSGSQLSGGYVCSPACLPAHSTEHKVPSREKKVNSRPFDLAAAAAAADKCSRQQQHEQQQQQQQQQQLWFAAAAAATT